MYFLLRNTKVVNIEDGVFTEDGFTPVDVAERVRHKQGLEENESPVMRINAVHWFFFKRRYIVGANSSFVIQENPKNKMLGRRITLGRDKFGFVIKMAILQHSLKMLAIVASIEAGLDSSTDTDNVVPFVKKEM